MSETASENIGRVKAREMLERLKPLQEPKGFYFNPDAEIAVDIMEQVLALKDKYGYMCCPCRLSTGVREKDKDISCPCDYRAADVQDFGTCYCGLYVSRDVHTGKAARQAIVERRPIEKILG